MTALEWCMRDTSGLPVESVVDVALRLGSVEAAADAEIADARAMGFKGEYREMVSAIGVACREAAAQAYDRSRRLDAMCLLTRLQGDAP